MNQIDKVLAEVIQPFSSEFDEQIHQWSAHLPRYITNYLIALDNIVKRSGLKFARIRQISTKCEWAGSTTIGEIAGEILTGYPPVQGCRHRQEHRIGSAPEKSGNRRADVSIVGQGMPAKHHQVQRHRPLPV